MVRATPLTSGGKVSVARAIRNGVEAVQGVEEGVAVPFMETQ
jgi:hypothetical protein